jgi:tRNA(adenine34) deaminase
LQAEAHIQLMRRALHLAAAAAKCGEVPVGAVIVDPATGVVVAEAFNQPVALCDPTAHAEILALRAAASALGNYRLTGLEMAVTLEPCAMCAAALMHARIGRVIYGAPDPKGGAVEHGPRLFASGYGNWRPAVADGVLAEECGELLRSFFRSRRA